MLGFHKQYYSTYIDFLCILWYNYIIGIFRLPYKEGSCRTSMHIMKQYRKSLDYKIYNDENLPDSGYEMAAIIFSVVSYLMVIISAGMISTYIVLEGANGIIIAFLIGTGVSLISLLAAITNNICACARLRKLRLIVRSKEVNQDKSPA